MSSTDNGSSAAASPDAPATDAYAITPHDTNDLTVGRLPRAIFVGVGGNISVDFGTDATAVIFKNVPAGAVLPIRPSRVRSTGTTATDLVALL